MANLLIPFVTMLALLCSKLRLKGRKKDSKTATSSLVKAEAGSYLLRIYRDVICYLYQSFYALTIIYSIKLDFQPSAFEQYYF